MVGLKIILCKADNKQTILLSSGKQKSYSHQVELSQKHVVRSVFTFAIVKKLLCFGHAFMCPIGIVSMIYSSPGH